jgi:hypothetical protein
MTNEATPTSGVMPTACGDPDVVPVGIAAAGFERAANGLTTALLALGLVSA